MKICSFQVLKWFRNPISDPSHINVNIEHAQLNIFILHSVFYLEILHLKIINIFHLWTLKSPQI